DVDWSEVDATVKRPDRFRSQVVSRLQDAQFFEVAVGGGGTGTRVQRLELFVQLRTIDIKLAGFKPTGEPRHDGFFEGIERGDVRHEGNLRRRPGQAAGGKVTNLATAGPR